MQPSNWEIHDLLGRARVALYRRRTIDEDDLIVAMCALEERLRAVGLVPRPAAYGQRVSDAGDSWTHWWVWSNDAIGPIVKDCETDRELLEELIGTSEGSPLAGYSPTGRPFNFAPTLQRGRYHTLITMHGGLDV